ncbi:hypothetical protein Tco_1414776 [Tanacetum coccineum]
MLVLCVTCNIYIHNRPRALGSVGERVAIRVLATDSTEGDKGFHTNYLAAPDASVYYAVGNGIASPSPSYWDTDDDSDYGNESLMIMEKLADVKTIAQGSYPEAERYLLSVGQSENLGHDIGYKLDVAALFQVALVFSRVLMVTRLALFLERKL